MANRLDGKVAFVTGAASGMGKAIALAYLQEGAKVVGGDVNMERMAELEQEVAELGLSASFKGIRCDITSTEDCAAALQATVDAFGYCNVLSHNAGISDDFTMAGDMDDAAWDRVIRINLTGAMKVTRAFLNYFRGRYEEDDEQVASIVMITSNGAFESATGGPAYCASKAGANALMKSIAFEYRRFGVRCNSICPGPVLTNITDSAPQRNPEGEAVHCTTGYNADAWKWTGGVLAMPEDIAPLAVYLASDESGFMNGNSCVIDGGVCLSR